MYIWIYIHTYLFIYVYMYIHIYVYKYYLYIHILTYTHIYTYTYTYIHRDRKKRNTNTLQHKIQQSRWTLAHILEIMSDIQATRRAPITSMCIKTSITFQNALSLTFSTAYFTCILTLSMYSCIASIALLQLFLQFCPESNYWHVVMGT
jgi:hypothetical protein